MTIGAKDQSKFRVTSLTMDPCSQWFNDTKIMVLAKVLWICACTRAVGGDSMELDGQHSKVEEQKRE